MSTPALLDQRSPAGESAGPGINQRRRLQHPNGIASDFDNDPNSIGTFSLTFNTQTQLMISVTAGTAPAGDTAALTTSPNIAGQFTLWFDANGDGKITANEVTTINFDETNPTISARRSRPGSTRSAPSRSAASWSATAATRLSRRSIRKITWSISVRPRRVWTNRRCCNTSVRPTRPCRGACPLRRSRSPGSCRRCRSACRPGPSRSTTFRCHRPIPDRTAQAHGEFLPDAGGVLHFRGRTVRVSDPRPDHSGRPSSQFGTLFGPDFRSHDKLTALSPISIHSPRPASIRTSPWSPSSIPTAP